MASPEKALFDKVVNSKGLKLRSKIAVRNIWLKTKEWT